MNSVKKLLTLIFTLVLGASLAAVPAVAFAEIEYDSAVSSSISSGSYVIDQSGLMSQSDVDRLTAKAQDVRDDYAVIPIYLTIESTDDYPDVEHYASDFIDVYHVDEMTANGCIVFVVCVNEGQFALCASGNLEKQLDDSTLEYLASGELNPYLGRGDWAGAGETFFSDVAQTLGGGTANSSSTEAYAGTYVNDNYGLFTDEQRASLEAKATELAQKYNMGVSLLVVDNMGSQNPTSAERTNFATSYYRANNLGLGSGKDGIMLVIAPGTRDYVTIAYGQGSYSFSDEGIAAMEEAVTDELHDDDWYGGSKAYYEKIGEQLEYYSVKGEPWTEPDFLSFILKILAILGIPAGVAFGKMSGEKSAMKTAREKSEASNYLDYGSFVLTRSDDAFVNTALAVTPIPEKEDSGGSGFGGGGWGGGGGGGFSSSGGGKF